MIDGIRRRLKSGDSETWDLDEELHPEVEESSDIPTDTAVLVAATEVAPSSSPSEINTGDYYKSLVKTAIDNGGKYGDHRIPIPWLRMVLAGLEWKRVDPESMWYGFEAASLGEPLGEIPAYTDLFPADRDPPSGPSLR